MVSRRSLAWPLIIAAMVIGRIGYAASDELSILSALEGVELASEPSAERKLLVYSKASGDVHESIPVVELVLRLLGEETGAYTAVFNNNEQEFTPDYLRQFDAVFFNNTSMVQDAFSTDAHREALLDYIRSGGGWAGLHAATDAGGDSWIQYTQMVGAQSDGAAWSQHGTWPLIVQDTEHPIASGFGREEFTVSDEVYQFKNYARNEMRVLVTVDVDESDPVGRPDHDNPVVWVKKYGEGRVFYTSLGHNKEIFFDATILQHILNGIEFALGSLKAGTSSLPMPLKVEESGTAHVPILSPEEELETIELQDGYYLELVVSDPIIGEPVEIAFDGNGRMYVAEFRTYMQNLDGSGQFDRTSRVSLHEDSDGDGTMDKHSVFIDNLLLPRIILPLDDRVIVGETNTTDLYAYRDTDNDGVADEKEPFFIGEETGRNLEHQQSGLIWSLDNWLYATISPYRLRYDVHGGLAIKEDTPPNRGQWGMTQNEYGKPYFMHAGAEIGPLQFQVPIVYGGIDVEGQQDPGYRTVWPIDNIPDAEGGTGRLRSDNTLNHFTATCGPEIFLGDRLPEELVGDLFFGEPVGRLVRRSTVRIEDGVTKLANAYQEAKSEFIRSSDPYFRPVNLETGPDGTLYIVDMYRGMIQEGTWMEKGSYLYGVVKEYGLDKNFGRGRIWRLRHEDYGLGPKPNMLKEKTSQLVEYLEHPNGWWRVTAQKLIVLRQDKSVVRRLKTMAKSSRSELGRVHAIWTLEGLEAADPEVIRTGLADPAPGVRRTAIRASESLIRRGGAGLARDILAMAEDEDPEVVIQALLTARYLKLEGATVTINRILASTESVGVREIVSQEEHSELRDDPALSTSVREFLVQGETTHRTVCFACHGSDGRGQPVGGAPNEKGKIMAPSFVDSDVVRGDPAPLIAIMLHGLTGNSGPGKEYPAIMVPMKTNSDEYIAATLSYIRYLFGGKITTPITPDDVANIREATIDQDTLLTPAELREIPNLDELH